MPAVDRENAGEDGTVVVNTLFPNRRTRITASMPTRANISTAQGGHHRPGEGHASALQNGASVACLLLTTESLIADIPEPKKDDHHDHHHGGGMGGMGGMGGAWVAWAILNDVIEPSRA